MGNDVQQNQVACIIDDWYLDCKGQFEGVHPLGARKEDLKRMLCEWVRQQRFAEKKVYP